MAFRCRGPNQVRYGPGAAVQGVHSSLSSRPPGPSRPSGAALVTAARSHLPARRTVRAAGPLPRRGTWPRGVLGAPSPAGSRARTASRSPAGRAPAGARTAPPPRARPPPRLPSRPSPALLPRPTSIARPGGLSPPPPPPRLGFRAGSGRRRDSCAGEHPQAVSPLWVRGCVRVPLPPGRPASRGSDRGRSGRARGPGFPAGDLRPRPRPPGRGWGRRGAPGCGLRGPLWCVPMPPLGFRH
ncbi:Xin Actin-Binding Repeat-Containing Protein 2 [Manis pentadactyla]|nr:Xin Actin-Binding Repeat-Containing Protein 2 [Manis pentadactyla]